MWRRITLESFWRSLGAVWEAYCGGPPYGRLSKTQIMVGVATQDLRPVFPPDTPAWYQDLAARCWNQNPDLR